MLAEWRVLLEASTVQDRHVIEQRPSPSACRSLREIFREARVVAVDLDMARISSAGR